MLSRAYGQATADEVANKQTHLTPSQQDLLRKTLDVFLLSHDTMPNHPNLDYNKCYSTKQQPQLFPSLCDNSDALVLECLLNVPSYQGENNPLTMVNIQNHQLQDAALIRAARNDRARYPLVRINSSNVICHRENPNVPNSPQQPWRIYLLRSLVMRVVRWYHLALGHPGKQCLYDTIHSRFYHPGLSVICNNCQCPEDCQMYKHGGQKYGHLAPQIASATPWSETAVDLIGPRKIKIGNKELEFKALTIIDPVTNLLEIIRINNKTSKHIAQQFANAWLSRYPWPTRVIRNNGTGFLGWEFQNLLRQFGITSVPTTVKNPQSNAIIEPHIHRTMGDMLRVLLHKSPPSALNDANQMVENALATCQHACRNGLQQRHVDQHPPYCKPDVHSQSATSADRRKSNTSECETHPIQLQGERSSHNG